MLIEGLVALSAMDELIKWKWSIMTNLLAWLGAWNAIEILEDALRPMSEVTNLSWMSVSDENNTSDIVEVGVGQNIKENWGVNPPLSCTGCHR